MLWKNKEDLKQQMFVLGILGSLVVGGALLVVVMVTNDISTSWLDQGLGDRGTGKVTVPGLIVASPLALYFLVCWLWGIARRRFVGKPERAEASTKAERCER